MAKRLWILVAALSGAAPAQEAAAPKPPAQLGVRIAAIDAETRGAYAIPEGVVGIVIVDAIPDTPAAKAGMKPGDVLVQFAGAPVHTTDELIALVRARSPGDEVAYVIRRGDGTIDGKLRLASPPGLPAGPSAEAGATPDPQLEERLDRVQRGIEELQRRIRSGGPRTIADWISREEKRLEEARASGDKRAIHRAEIRLELLREMEEQGVRGIDERLDRIQEKLDRILKRLGER